VIAALLCGLHREEKGAGLRGLRPALQEPRVYLQPCRLEFEQESTGPFEWSGGGGNGGWPKIGRGASFAGDGMAVVFTGTSQRPTYD